MQQTSCAQRAKCSPPRALDSYARARESPRSMPRASSFLGRDDLVLCAGTIPNASFAERVASAQAGGFAAISLSVRHHAAARADGLSDADMRAMLDDGGIRVAEIEVLNRW